MSIVIQIDGVDRSSSVDWESIVWSQALTNQVDVLRFTIKKFGSRTYKPSILDPVIMIDQGETVFGGNIISIQEDVQGVDSLVFKITVKDNSHVMDRRLVVEQFEDKPVINIINEIRNRYINAGERVAIADFEANEIWSGGAIDSVNFRTGARGRKLTSVNNANADMDRLIYLDLQPSGFGATDEAEIEIYVDTVANLDRCRLQISTLNDFSDDYFLEDITSQITQDGWNLIKVTRSDFDETGTPDWTNIQAMKIDARSKAATTVVVTFDNYQFVKAGNFSRDNALDATQEVNWIAFNYETPSKCLQRLAELFNWNWYVDPLKDINFFPKFEKAAAFSLTDTSGNYIYKSLKVNGNADQIRNSIFVRGADYLGATETEDLSYQADNSNRIFKLGYKYKYPDIEVNGTRKSLGADNIDQFNNTQGAVQLQNGGTAIKVGENASQTYQAQQIIVGKHGRRASVRLRVRKVGSPVDNFQVAIYADDGSDKPDTGTLLSSVAILAGGSINTTFVENDFTVTEAGTNDLLFDPDDKYHIVVSRSGGIDAVNYYEVDVSDVATYDGYQHEGDAVPAWTRLDSVFYFVETIDYDVLHSFNEKIVVFETAPAGSDQIDFTGDPYLPVFVLYQENSSIGEFGEYQHKVIDKSIKTKEGARQRANEEIIAWSEQVNEASFKTYDSGLLVGQTINIQSDIRDLNDSYIIQRVIARSRTPEKLEYEVTCVTTRTFSIMYWLQQQIAKDDREITIDDNEQQDKIQTLSETFSFTTEYTLSLVTGKVWGLAGSGTDLVWDGGAADIWI